ncbi:hypothetical protein HII31_07726 [Pseudocercospora fuligena]|uniref:Uncharacterized protein n=1 Tax=Pseudocercospora fuligena TaxID=685502 RepID=A0A8H6RHC9_9PEZI|nr:hypothetical protein HII31_07726 [Pseudocercospora fuligena]
MESEQQRKQPARVLRQQQQHDDLQVIDLTQEDTLLPYADRDVNTAARRPRVPGPVQHSSGPIGSNGAQQRPSNPFDTASKRSSGASVLGGCKDLIVIDPQLGRPGSTERKQEQPNLDAALSKNAGATAQQELDSSAITQASAVRKQQHGTPDHGLSPDLALMAQKLIHDKGWSPEKFWHWHYNGMPVEEAPGVSNDPLVPEAPESEGVYEFFDWRHYHLRRAKEGIDPKQCKTVHFSGLDVEKMLHNCDATGELGSRILLRHTLDARKEFPNLEKLSFAERAFGPPTEASYDVKELFIRRFRHEYKLTCISPFVWSLTFSASHMESQDEDEPCTEEFEVFITHFRALKAFEEEQAKFLATCQKFGPEIVRQRLCHDTIDDMSDIWDKFGDSRNFARLMELRHILACLRVQSTLERQLAEHKVNHPETAWYPHQPCDGWLRAQYCYPGLWYACKSERRREEFRRLLKNMKPGMHLQDLKGGHHECKTFTEVMTLAETWFPRIFFTDDLRQKYGNPWTQTVDTEEVIDNEPNVATEDTHSVVPGDIHTASRAPQPSSDDRGVLATSSIHAGQDSGRSKKRRTSADDQSENKRRARASPSTKPPRKRRHVDEKPILPKQPDSQQPLESSLNCESGQETAYSSLLVDTQPTASSESISEAAQNSHLAEALVDGPRPLRSYQQFDSAMGWPQYEGQASRSMEQPGYQNWPDDHTSNTEFVAETHTIKPDYDPQSYPPVQPSEHVMGWQQPGSQAYNAANQLENQHGFNNYSLPNDSSQPYMSYPQPEPAMVLQQPGSQTYNAAGQLENQYEFNDYSLSSDSNKPYPSFPRPDPAMGWHQHADHAYNATDELQNPYGSYEELPAEDYGRLAEDDAEIAYNLSQMVPSDVTQLDQSCSSFDPAMAYQRDESRTSAAQIDSLGEVMAF